MESTSKQSEQLISQQPTQARMPRRAMLRTLGTAALGGLATHVFTASDAEAASGTVAGAVTITTVNSTTSLTLSVAPTAASANRSWVVIEPFTTDCEIRKVTAIAGATVTLDRATVKTHAAGDVVLWTDEPIFNVVLFGATGDASTDDTNAITAAIADAAPSENRQLYFPAGQYKVTSTIQINTRGFQFIGVQDTRPGTTGGTSRLNYYGTGPLIQLGTDNGHAHDLAEYDGPQSLALRNISLAYTGGGLTALANGQQSYKAGSYGIRDWRAGDVILDNVWIENFEYGFWGIQSDINYFTNFQINYCKVGIYLGPRSDQCTIDHLYTYANDTALQIDRATHARVRNCQFVGDGSASTSAVQIGSDYSFGAWGIIFDTCWFEHYQGASEIETFVSIGSGDSAQSMDITFRDCIVLTNTQATTYHAKHFIKIGNATRVVIERLSGNPNNLLQTLKFVTTATAVSPIVQITVGQGTGSTDFNPTFTNGKTDGGTPLVQKWMWGYGHNELAASDGRLYISHTPADTLKDFFISSEIDKTLRVVFPNTGDGNTVRLHFDRRIIHGTAAPISGTWDRGDIVLNNTPSSGGYVGWVCVASGTPGTWKTYGLIS